MIAMDQQFSLKTDAQAALGKPGPCERRFGMTIVKNSVFVIASIVAVMLLSQRHALVGQDAQLGTIQGTVMREGTTEPLADVQITVLARGSLAATGFSAQQVLQAVNRGAAVNPELVQMAQDATRGGPRAAIANAAPVTAVSDSAGRFTIRNISAGEHYVRAQLQNYFGPINNGARAPVASETVVVTGQQTTEVRLSLIQGGTISGRVLDPTGKPLQNAPVQALQSAYDNGAPSLQIANLKPTDDRGEFRLGVLAPGEYYLAVTPPPAGGRGASSPAITLAGEVAITTLYPNTTDSTKAVPIVLNAGGDVSGMSIQLKTVPGVKISGRVTHTLPATPPAAPRGGIRPLIAVVGLARRDRPALPDVIGAGAGITASDDGSFEILNVPPGSYDLFARLPIASGWGGLAPPERATTPLAIGRTSVEVRAGNVDGVTVLVHPGVDLKGRVTIDGQPPTANSIRVSLAPDDSATRVGETQISNIFGQIAQYPARIEQDGSFTIPFIPEGHYRVQATFTSQAANSYIADIRQGAASIFDNGLTVGREAVNPLEIVVNTNGGSIEGTVLGADRKPVPRTTIVMVPPTGRRQNSALYKFVQTDAQGHFSIAGVAPGSWKLFAWESIRPGAYQNAEFIQKYEARGTNVVVTAGMQSNSNPTLIRD